MTHAHDMNVVGALGLLIADRLAAAGDAHASGSAAEALVTLHQTGGGLTIDALARIVGLSHSGTVRLADRLQATGLLERRAGPDGRSTSLRLTVNGRRAARRTLALRDSAVQTILAELPPADRRSLAAAAERILAGVARAEASRDRICRLCDRDACGRRAGRCPVAAAASSGSV